MNITAMGTRLVALFLFSLMSQWALAHVSAENAWVRLLPPNMTTTAAYVTLTPSHDDRLVGARSDIATRVEIHESTMADGVMSMRPLEGVDMKDSVAVQLKPQGVHLMLIGLKRPLKEGEMIGIELELEQTGVQKIPFTVRKP